MALCLFVIKWKFSKIPLNEFNPLFNTYAEYYCRASKKERDTYSKILTKARNKIHAQVFVI